MDRSHYDGENLLIQYRRLKNFAMQAMYNRSSIRAVHRAEYLELLHCYWFACFYRIRSNPTVVHPKFSSFSSRFKTFKLFPSNTSQNKYTLSECGLKYSGVDDVVECFCCGLILHNWERLDDPWIEHCRFSPRCLYVLLMKGNQYVQNILSKYCKTEHICNCETGSYDTVC
ncbi:putative inhibitor of apoptosis [Metopolophium dirhodum]|uniref:putative inhibitor of apoptosis n=1 Tax=Metopolophium dirhodum TaxID=44670 RepID=UPI00298FFF8D|nr:putative inhibitor of apoptosis [Metopolophium dirhodum]